MRWVVWDNNIREYCGGMVGGTVRKEGHLFAEFNFEFGVCCFGRIAKIFRVATIEGGVVASFSGHYIR